MSIAYDGPASITLWGTGHPLTPTVTLNENIQISLREDASLALATVHFSGKVNGLDGASRTSIILPCGFAMTGPLIDFSDGDNAGFLNIQVESP